MKKFIFVCGLVLACSFSAMAQTDFSKVDIFGGYSYVRFNFPNQILNANGASGQITYNLNSVIGITGDFGGYHISAKGDGGSGTVFTYMFGPKFSLRQRKWTPYAQTLFGGGRIGAGIEGVGATSFSGFTMVIGTGVDYKAADHVSLRLFDVDYLMTRFNSSNIGGSSNTQNNARISTGVVFNF
jgi:hypothetical protein